VRPSTLAAVLALTAAPLTPALADDDAGKTVSVSKVEYRGWKNNLRISNGDAELIVTLDVGPRVISYKLAEGKNVFKNYDEMMGGTGEAEWKIRGGHRLWVGPEDTTRTYAPDNGPVAYKVLGPGRVRFTQPPDAYGLQKEIEVELAPSGSRVALKHRVTNVGQAETRLAVWALSVMAPGGVEVIPLPPKRPHPGDVKNARSAADFAPNQLLVLWPFFDFKDPRFSFGTRFLTLRHDPGRGATKIGLAHRGGAVGYLNGGTLFVKRFEFREGRTYPDHGVNFETYTDQDMLEVETLAPLTRLAPRDSAEHLETWELFGGVGAASTEDEIGRNVGPRLK
jgi:hypothetical protein